MGLISQVWLLGAYESSTRHPGAINATKEALLNEIEFTRPFMDGPDGGANVVWRVSGDDIGRRPPYTEAPGHDFAQSSIHSPV